MMIPKLEPPGGPIITDNYRTSPAISLSLMTRQTHTRALTYLLSDCHIVELDPSVDVHR